MKKFKGVTIRYSLILSAIGVILILLIILFSTNFYIKKVSDEYNNIQQLDNIKKKDLEIHNLEKEFLLYETINSDFYLTQNSSYLDSINKKLKEINSILQKLKSSNLIYDESIRFILKEIVTLYENYKIDLNHLNELILNKGFKDHGTIGKMRQNIHEVENIVNLNKDLQSSKYLLLLRRHEKDYLLRKDLKYKEKFKKTYDEFLIYLKYKHNTKYLELIKKLQQYQDLFNKVIEIDTQIGRSSEDGLFKKIRQNSTLSSELLADLISQAKNQSLSQIKHSIIRLFSIITILSLLIVFTLYNVSKRVFKSVKSLEIYITKLGKGELPEQIEIKYDDEIGKMKKSINILTDNLRRTKDFAMAVGNGDFKKEINVFDNKGDLGHSLVDMRNSLLKVSEERLLQKKKDDQRLWTNEGLTIFADLLRKEHSSIKDMCYEIISNLIKYINANQAYIFLKNNVNGETFLDLQAAFAYDRRKFADRKIKLGEGLVGSCAIEMETIFMTDIPEDYINITSGLGYSNPRTLLIIPLKIESELIGIIELASFEILPPFKVKFIEKVAESIASHIANIQINIKTNKLLEQTKKQAQELSEKEEEMMQNMEELKIIQEKMTDREEELLTRIEELEKC